MRGYNSGNPLGFCNTIHFRKRFQRKKNLIFGLGLFLLLLLVMMCGCISATGNTVVPKAKITVYEREAGHSGTVYIDGNYLGIAPVASPQKSSFPVTKTVEAGLTTVVNPGTYEIKIVDPKCRNNVIRNVTVEPGEELIIYGYCV